MAKGSITLSGSTVGTKMESLEVEQGATGGVAGLLKVDNDDVDKQAIVVEASNTTADTIDITSAATSAKVMDIVASGVLTGDVVAITADSAQTGTGINMSMDALTTGGALKIDSDSSTTGTRNLVEIINNNTAATGATALKVQQDSSGDAAVFQGGNIRVTKGGSAFQTSLHHAWAMGG